MLRPGYLKAMSYTELHLHSHWSLLEGASSPLELVLRARELGYEALALTDHDGLYGAMEFAQCGPRLGHPPHHRGGGDACPTLPPARNQGRHGGPCAEGQGYHLTLLCETQRGYANLCRLLSHAHLTHEKGRPAIEPDVLATHAEGLIALSGCRRGEVPSLVAEGRFEEAEAAARRYVEMFGRQSFFIELQQNLVHGDTARNRELVALAKRLELGVVATNNVHYHVRERHRLQDVLVAVKHRTSLESSHTLRRANSEFYLKSPQEMARLFADCPEALANTVRIADRCAPSRSSGCGSAGSGQGFDLTRDLDYRFPNYPCPPGETPDSVLRGLCFEEARRRYGLVSGRLPQQVESRLEEELREVPSLVAEGRIEEAEAAARRYVDMFGPQSFFIELQQNLVHGDTARNRELVALAKRLGLGVRRHQQRPLPRAGAPPTPGRAGGRSSTAPPWRPRTPCDGPTASST